MPQILTRSQSHKARPCAMFESLRGQFLVAGKALRDPNFYKSVVLLLEHGPGGALGLVVNRPTAVKVSTALGGPPCFTASRRSRNCADAARWKAAFSLNASDDVWTLDSIRYMGSKYLGK